MRSLHIKFLKSLLLVICLGMIANLVACGGSSSKTTTPPPPPPTVSIAATSGSSQSAAVGAAFTNPLVATVTTGGTPTKGVTVTFTAPSSGASGTFAGGVNTATTDANGKATSPAFTANSTAGTYTVTASVSGASTPASFSLTNTAGRPTTLADGNYVFSITGTDTNSSGSSFANAGSFTVASNVITGGREDYSDKAFEAFEETITGGTVASTTDANLEITLTFTPITGDPRTSGTTVLHASLVTTSKALLMEYDGWAAGTGELDLQATSLAAPSSSYAFYMNGGDFYGPPISLGGLINVDGTGTVSGAGSIFDINDSCDKHLPCTAATYFGQTLAANVGTVTGPDQFGYVVFQLPADCTNVATDHNLCNGGPTGTGGASLIIDGYMIDATHIRIIEDWFDDSLGAYVAGTAIGQTSAASVAGSTYVVGLQGNDSNGALQVAGQLAFASSGNAVSGNLSYNDRVLTSAQGGANVSGTFSVNSSGIVSVTGLTDGTVTFDDLQLYLTGDGHAFVISMDSTAATNPDEMAGLSHLQAASTFTVASVSGTYALDLVGVPAAATEGDALGAFFSDGSSTITGYQDQNDPFVPSLVANNMFTNTYASTATNGVFGVKNSGGTFNATVYLIDGTQGVLIENDTTGLTLGYFTNQ